MKPQYIYQMLEWAEGEPTPAVEPIFVPPRVRRALNPYHPHTEEGAKFEVKLRVKVNDAIPEHSYAFIDPVGESWNETTKDIMRRLKLRPIIGDDEELLYMEDSELVAPLNNGWRAVCWRSTNTTSSSREPVFLDEILWVKGLETVVTGWTWPRYLGAGSASDAT